jgi:4-hydroxybenzoate polyprenyltransferase
MKKSLKDWLSILRISHWIKNGFVILPFIFSGKWKPLFSPLFASSPSVPSFTLIFQICGPILCAFFSFSFIASGIYIFNDWQDREQDKIHPKKQLRAIPSGRISRRVAFSTMAFLWWSGSLLSFYCLSFTASAILLTYLFLNIAYSLKLKHTVLLDVMTIASGFVLRVLFGATAIQVPSSFWIFSCTFLLALFLGFCKRRQELILLEEAKIDHRKVLEHYSLPFLDQIISLTTACTLMSYLLYTHDPETIQKQGSAIQYTSPFVLYGILRYYYLIYQKAEGGNPTQILYTDPGILSTCILWILCVCLILLYS